MRSNEALQRCVIPVLAAAMAGGVDKVPAEFTIMELASSRDPIAKRLFQQFDVVAGIDLWVMRTLKEQREGLRGVASRVQFGPCYETFTIRRTTVSGQQTEIDKRRHAIACGWLYPYYALQAYCTNGGQPELIKFALTETEALVALVGKQEEECVRLQAEGCVFRTPWEGNFAGVRNNGERQHDANEFWFVRWSTLRREGLNIWTWGADGRLLRDPVPVHQTASEQMALWEWKP